jgi:hypothetical protein
MGFLLENLYLFVPVLLVLIFRSLLTRRQEGSKPSSRKVHLPGEKTPSPEKGRHPGEESRRTEEPPRQPITKGTGASSPFPGEEVPFPKASVGEVSPLHPSGGVPPFKAEKPKGASFLETLDHLPPLQRAFVLQEVLGPPQGYQLFPPP